MKRIGLLGWLFLVALVLSSCSQVAPPPTPTELARAASSSDYLIDFQTAPVNQILYSVNTKSGVVYKGSGAANPNNILVLGKRRLGYGGIILPGHLSKVIDIYGSKRLTIVSGKTSTTPHSLGGRIKIEFAPKFNASGATVASFKVSNITASSSYVQIYNVDGSTRRVYIPKGAAGQTQTVVLNAAGVRALDFYAPTAYAVDDVVFRPGGGTSPSTCSAALSSSSAFPGDTLTLSGIPSSWAQVTGKITAPASLTGGSLPVTKGGDGSFSLVTPYYPENVVGGGQVSVSFTDGRTSCNPINLTVRALAEQPTVPGTTLNIIQVASSYIDRALAAADADRSVFANPNTIPPVLQMAYVLYDLTENPNNPNSYRNILDRGTIILETGEESMDPLFLDTLLYQMKLVEFIGKLSVNGNSTTATVSEKGFSTLALLSKFPITSVADLVLGLNARRGYEAVAQIGGEVELAAAAITPVLNSCRLVTLGICERLLKVTAGIAAGVSTPTSLAKIFAAQYPPDYSVSFSLTKTDFNEDSTEGGAVTSVQLKPADSIPLKASDLVSDLASRLISLLIGKSEADELTKSLLELYKTEVTAIIGAYGPDAEIYTWAALNVPTNEVSKYFDLNVIGDAITLQASDLTFKPVKAGGATIELNGAFLNLDRSYAQDVRVNPIEVKVTPQSATAEIGKATCFTAEVLNADDTSVEWSANPQEGQANGNQYCWTPRNPTAPPPGEEPSIPATSILVTAASKSRPERTGSASASVEATGSESFEVRYGAGWTINGSDEPPEYTRTYFLEASNGQTDVNFLSFLNIDSQPFCNEYGSAWQIEESEQHKIEAKSYGGSRALLKVDIKLNNDGFEVNESAQLIPIDWQRDPYNDPLSGAAHVHLSQSLDSRGRHGLVVRSNVTVSRLRKLQITWSEKLSNTRIKSDPPFVAVLNCSLNGYNQAISPSSQNTSSQSFALAHGNYQILIAPGKFDATFVSQYSVFYPTGTGAIDRNIRVSLAK